MGYYTEYRYYVVDPQDAEALPFMRGYLCAYLRQLQRIQAIKAMAREVLDRRYRRIGPDRWAM